MRLPARALHGVKLAGTVYRRSSLRPDSDRLSGPGLVVSENGALVL